MRALAHDTPTINVIGTTFSHYRILEELGHGGMGVVYRARDEHLPRDVALKVLPAGLFSDETARSRFRREAHTLSQLNHPNIATVFDFDRENGVDFLAMEFVEGETLAAKVAASPLLEREVIALGTQIAEALEDAHEHGIIHRDLKPGNVMVNAKGRAKVLDFGLAKLLSPAQVDAATASLPETQAGAILGTVPYMAPEQLRGEEVDARADLYALGAVLYELATGRKPFPDKQSSQLIVAILTQTPPMPRHLNGRISPGLDGIILKALQKNREDRYQTAAGLRADLESLKHDSAIPAGAYQAPERWTPRALSARRRWMLGLSASAVLAVLVGAVFFFLLLNRPHPQPRVTRITQLTGTGRQKWNRLVTDGPRIYFSDWIGGGTALLQVSASGGDAVPVPTLNQNVWAWDISPNGSELLVNTTAGFEQETPLRVASLVGGVPRRLGNILAHDATWSPDGKKIVYAKGESLFAAATDASESRRLLTASGVASWPRWSPDGTLLRFTVSDPNTGSGSLWEASADGTGLHRLLAGWNVQSNECCGNWTADGSHFVFQAQRDGRWNLWATRERAGVFQNRAPDPVQLTDGPMDFSSPTPSRNGEYLFAVGTQPRGELVRYDVKSRHFEPFLSGISAQWVEFSRDEAWVLYVTVPEGSLWRSKPDGGERVQLTLPPLQVQCPRWSPDGKRIAFMGRKPGGTWKVFILPADGGEPVQLIPSEGEQADPQWSPDGNALLFNPWSVSPYRSLGLHLFDLTTRQISDLPGSAEFSSPRWSRDGRHIAAFGPNAASLVLFDSQTKKWETLDRGVVIAFDNWSRDGDYVYYWKFQGTTEGVYRVALRNRVVEAVTNTKSGEWLGLAPDDSPLMLRDTSIQEVYALEWKAP